MIHFNKKLLLNGIKHCFINNKLNINNNNNSKLNTNTHIINNQFKLYFSSNQNNQNNQNNQKQTINQKLQQQPINQTIKPQITPQQTQQKQQKFTPQQQQLIKTHQPDELFNLLINLDPNHNLQKDLIIAKKTYQKSTKQLRASILFQDLLKSQIIISIYDTKGKPYTHFWIKNIINITFLCLTIYLIKQLEDKDPKNKVLLQRTTAGKFMKTVFIGFASWFVLLGLWKYLRFQRRFVQSIVYDTKTQSFILKKRGFFGSSYDKQVSRFKLVYTENEFLNKKGTNYFNLDTKEEYSIPYKQSWIKQDLFSHLISQRIKL